MAYFSYSFTQQAPEKFNYQAVARDMEAGILANEEIGLRVSILFGLESGRLIYAEEHEVLTNKPCLFTIAISTVNH